MKRIGVLGGIGPQATMEFEARLHEASQQLIPADANMGYPPMMVFYHRSAPMRLGEGGAPVLPIKLDPDLLEGARLLGAWADFLVVTSNGVHQWLEQIEQAAGRPVLSVIDVVVQEVNHRGWRRVGLMTYREPTVYIEPLTRQGVACEVLAADLQARLDDVVPGLMAGRPAANAMAVAKEAIEALRGRGIDGIVLGCSEHPLMLGDEAEAADLINPMRLLAEAAVRYAMG